MANQKTIPSRIIQIYPAEAESRLQKIADSPVKVDRYSSYWKSLIPINILDYYTRWTFAIVSVNNAWEPTVKAYQAVRRLVEREVCYFQRTALTRTLRRSQTGLHIMHSRALWNFHINFWAEPLNWGILPGESIIQTRNRLAETQHGIRLAKSSFGLELLHPFNQNVICVDRHMADLYKVSRGDVKDYEVYRAIERHWCDTCKRLGLPSVMARHIWWDSVQGRLNTRYWSQVFETGLEWKFDPFIRKKGKRVPIE
jgi:hypothetical protein